MAFTYTIIQSEETAIEYQLSALLTKDGYEMVSLKGSCEGEEVFLWDGEYMLYNTFYPNMQKFANGESVEWGETGEEIANELRLMQKEDAAEIVALFDKAKFLGFFNQLEKVT